MSPSIVMRQGQWGICDCVKPSFPTYDWAITSAFGALSSEHGCFTTLVCRLPFHQ